MTDGDLTGASEARGRARALLERAAGRRAAAAEQPEQEAAPDPTPLELIGEASSGLGAGLHDLLRDMAAYLGDRPQRDAEAMGLYQRVMRMLGDRTE